MSLFSSPLVRSLGFSLFNPCRRRGSRLSDGFAALATLGLFIKPARKIAGFPSSVVHQQFVVVAVYLSYLAVQSSLWVRSCLISRACHRFCVFTCPRQVQRQLRLNVFLHTLQCVDAVQRSLWVLRANVIRTAHNYFRLRFDGRFWCSGLNLAVQVSLCVSLGHVCVAVYL